MVVMGRLAGNVGVLTGGQIKAFQDVQVGEQVECPKYRRSTDAQAAIARLIDEVGRREVALALLDQLRDSATWLREPVSGEIECRHERLWFCHAAR